MKQEPQTVPLNAMVLYWQRIMVEKYADEHGGMSLSQAVRSIYTEYRNMKAIEAGIPLSALPQEEAA